MMNSEKFGNDHSDFWIHTFDFSNIIAEDTPVWPCLNTHPSAPNSQTHAFINVLTSDQVMKLIC